MGIVFFCYRLREERGEAERALALDHKVRDLSSNHGSSNGHSPVLNLSKNGGGDVHSGSEAGGGAHSEEGCNPEEEDEEEDDNPSDPDDDDKDHGEFHSLEQPVYRNDITIGFLNVYQVDTPWN
ncbi:hypothetical protein AAG570_003704 [Ranatra chinensis]|uniref:Uncharacterized protein n=1 Tax=Ranatra chinensis TaxID=642074 RepID=A0ABD0Y6N7_9HEMI